MSTPGRIVAWLLCLPVMGCFSDPGASSCAEGSEGCNCVELQCEGGLVCAGGLCVAIVASSSEGSSSSSTNNNNNNQDDTSGAASTSMVDGTTTMNSEVTGEPSSTGSVGSTGEMLCGNGVLDPGEMCDGTAACDADCVLENYPCNPLNNVGCDPGQKCSFVEPQTITCLAFDEVVGEFGANDCYYGGAAHDESCAIGLACLPFQITKTCAGGGCCEEYCDLGDGFFECSTPGNTCQLAYAVPPFESGLEWLGVCIN